MTTQNHYNNLNQSSSNTQQSHASLNMHTTTQWGEDSFKPKGFTSEDGKRNSIQTKDSSEYSEKLMQSIQEQPFAALAIAGTIGFIFAKLFRK